MKTLLKKYWSPILNVILVITLVWCLFRNTDPEPKLLSSYTQQEIDKAAKIRPGMSADEIVKIMGEPVKREFVGGKEEWHYCRTGESVDEYVAIRLEEGGVSEMEQYTVTYLDILFHHTLTPSEEVIAATGLGDCKLKVRWGTYGQKVPQRWIPGEASQTMSARRPAVTSAP
jgi:outer membrane protein assembly factor BamE (lipoprotein component of BamABCDE complex)